MAYEIETKDGIVISDIPDSVRPDDPELKRRVSLIRADRTNKRVAQYAASPEIQKHGGELATRDTSTPMRFFSGMGKAGYDLARGAGQLIGTGPTAEEVAETRRRDAPLMETGAGVAGNIIGNAIPAMIGGVMAPGYAGAVGTGAALGLLQPAMSADERIRNTGLSGAAGAAGQFAGNILGRIIRPTTSTLTPEAARLAQAAQREGIPLDAAALTGSKTLKTINATLENMPLTAGREGAKIAERQAAFNAAALRRAGSDATTATPAVLSETQDDLARALMRVYKRNKLPLHGGLSFEMRSVADDAAKWLGDADAAPMKRFIQNLEEEVAKRSPKAFKIPGERVQALREELRPLASGNDQAAKYWRQIRDLLRDHYRDALPPKAQAKWDAARVANANLQVIKDAMGGAGIKPSSGDISPAQLSAALAKSVGRQGKAVGRGDLNDVARIGQMFVREQIPDSGTAQRSLHQWLLTAGQYGAMPGLGGAAGYIGSGGDPMMGLAGMGVALGGPRAFQAALNNPAVQRYIVSGVQNPQAIAIANALRTIAAPSATALSLNAQ